MKTNRLFAFLFVLCLLVGLCCFPAAAATTGSCGDNATWTFDASTGILTISGTGPMTNYIHEEAMPWYTIKQQIIHVVIEEGITSVGDFAFCRHRQIKSLTLADSVKTIGNHAFVEDWGITDISFGIGITSIGEEAFGTCDGMTSITLPSSLKTISKDAFNDCWSLEKISTSEGLTEIERCGFRNTEITKIFIPSSVTAIGEGAFHLCEVLQDVYYTGTQEQWNSISIHSGSNDPLFAANIHFEHSHSFDGGSVTRQATCKQKGIKTYLCTVCGAAKQETFSASHNWDNGNVTAATCTKDGAKVYTCNLCKDTMTEPIAATGHSWDSGTKNADTTVTYKCTVCSTTKTEGTPVTPAETTKPTGATAPGETTSPTVEAGAIDSPSAGETTSPIDPDDTTGPTAPVADTETPEKRFPWGIVIGVAVIVLAGGSAGIWFWLKKKNNK